jgi:hypothetical protein
MTRDDDFIGQLEGYLDEYEGLTLLPDAIRDTVRAQLPTTRQIGLLPGPMRYLNFMSKPIQFAVAAAAVLLIAVVGYQLLLRPNIGGPGQTETPQPSSTPSSSASASAAPAGLLEPGLYTLFVLPDFGSITGTVTIPGTGWHGAEGDGLVDNGSADPPGGAAITVTAGGLEVYGNPCQWATTRPDPMTGPSVDDLVADLSAQQLRNATAPTDITVDGHPGKAIELTVPADVNLSDCDLNEFRTWREPASNSSNANQPGQHDLVWIFDVNGTRVVADVSSFEGTSAADIAGLQAILDSIHIQ